jgi:hypothetical protein
MSTIESAMDLAKRLQEKINYKPTAEPISPRLDRLLNTRAGSLTPGELLEVYDYWFKLGRV